MSYEHEEQRTKSTTAPESPAGRHSMYLLKLIGLTLVQLARQVWRLPRSIVDGCKHWRRQAALDELEAERLDRIRNPSKYLGKS